MIQKYSKKIGRVIVILIASTCLSQVFCVDNEEFFKKVYTALGAVHTKELGTNVLNEVLANPEIFHKGRSTDQSVARHYFTVEFLALSKENLETVIQTNVKTFKETLFGKSLMLGWALHRKDGYNLLVICFKLRQRSNMVIFIGIR